MKFLMRSLFAILLPALATSANATCADWSKTASSNATADPTINWSVGMSPSSVSASGRAMMARLAECRDDLSGSLTTGGTSTAYTLTTNQGLSSPPNNGQSLSFTAHATNGAAATLAVDGGTAYPIQTSPGTAASAGILISGTPYTVKFSNADSAWILHGFFGSPFIVPIGAMLPYTGSSAPNSNFVLPAGQCISRTTYATYFSLVGTTYGGCDGSTTFAVPDMRGKTIFALDNLGGSAAGILTSTYAGASTTTLGTAVGTQSKNIGTTNLPASPLAVSGTASVTSTRSDILANPSGVQTQVAGTGFGVGTGSGGVTGYPISSSGSISGTTANMGNGTPLSAVPPAIMITLILRVL